jgi:hypothetical protein
MKKQVILTVGAVLLVGGVISTVWSFQIPGCNSVSCLLFGDYSSLLTTVESVAPTIVLLIGIIVILYGRSIDNQFDKPKTGKGLYDDMKPEKM